MKKNILFISALDFKEKSIQVVLNTPKSYVEHGWEVHYVVMRNNSKVGDFYYEKELNPKGIKIYRGEYPLTKLINNTNSKYGLMLLRGISIYLVIYKLFLVSLKVSKTNSFDIIYGYESHGIWAAKLLKFFTFSWRLKLVARFQGTFFNKFLNEKKWLHIILHIEKFLPLYFSSNLCIMTDDGTQGDKALSRINSRHLKNFKFWVNGVDNLKLDSKTTQKLRTEYVGEVEVLIISISRLVKWKRLDRGILSIASYVNKSGNRNFKYLIIGEGDEKENLNQLIKQHNLEGLVELVGAIPYVKVKEYLNIADIFISLYEGSNVGNPLLEAIRTHNIIFTVNNGDTAKWIEHKKNGFIFKEDENLIENVSNELNSFISGSYSKEKMLKEIEIIEKNKLWTWEKRMNEEVCAVEKLLKS